MKRGWITWDQNELPPAAFEARLAGAMKVLREQDIACLVIYSDVWRSNQARYFSNYMPYWNRALLVVPQQAPPILLCALSRRVYPWISSVTVLNDIRPASNLAQQLLLLASEKQWKKIGVLDLHRLPQDIYAGVCAGEVEVVDVPSDSVPGLLADETELAMRRRAARMAREILARELGRGAGGTDHQFVGRLERSFRRAGAEDLVVLVSNGTNVPSPPVGTLLGETYSVAVALEYRGHWVKLSRAQAPLAVAESIQKHFDHLLKDTKAPVDTRVHIENLSGPYPYEPCEEFPVSRGSIFAVHMEHPSDGSRFFHGDTCWYGETGVSPL